MTRLDSVNQSPLHINTFEGSNSPYHPSVKYRREGFGGFEYIMSETPFFLSLPAVGDNYRDQYECPSIHYSHDGIHWEDKIDNPIDSLTPEEIANLDYFSDPDLVETPEGIECWYRINRRYGIASNQENVILLRKKSSDGVHWGDREVIADLQNVDPNKGLGRVVISPTLLFEDTKYKCWFVDNIHLHKEQVCYSESTDYSKSWTNKRTVKLNGPKITPWHLHILRDGDVLWLTIYDHRNITLWKSKNETEFDFVKTLITPCGVYGSFYCNNTYRACLLRLPDNSFRLYFSADDMFKSYIGVMEGETPETMVVISVDGGHHSKKVDALELFFKSKYKVWSSKLRYYSKRLYQKPIEIIKSHVRS